MAKAVMLIPNTQVARTLPKKQPVIPADLSLHQHNWVVGQQFREVSPSSRELVTVKVDGSLRDDFGPAVRDAARRAEKGGMVILFTGHGCRAGCVGGACQWSPAQANFGFETLPETASPKTKRIDSKVLNFLKLAQRAGTGWAPKAQEVPGSTTVMRESQSTIDALVPKWEALDVMREAFTSNGTDRLVLLTCNVGTFPQECQALADRIGTTVVAYREKIATNELNPPFNDPPGMKTRPVQCWCTTPPHTLTAPARDPMTTQIATPHNDAMERWILSNWRRHPYFSSLPAGPVVECVPGGRPRDVP